VQCLYCETELKPLRGLFDEDFCCKEHREKYFSSFRKGINRLPVLDLPPLAPTRQRNLEEAETEAMAEPVPPRRLETEQEPVALPEPVIAMVAEEVPQLEPETVLAVAEEEPEVEPAHVEPAYVEPVREAPQLVIEIAARAPELPAVEEPVVAAATIEADLDEDAAEEAEFTPLTADFLHLHIAPSGAADCYFMVDENSFSACNGPAIPDVEVFCDAAFDPEENLAHLVTPADMAAGASGRAATPEAQPAFALSRSFNGWPHAGPPVPTLESAELIEDVEMFVAGGVSRQMARSTGSHPLSFASAPVTVPAFQGLMADGLQPRVAEAVALDVMCQQIESAPLMFSDMAPALEVHSPVFQVSAAAMQLDEELKRAAEAPKQEAVRLAEPEIARPAVMSAAPVSHSVSAASFQPAMPAPARPESQLSVPAMSSRTDAVPSVASEAVPDPPRGAVAEQPPSAHSSDPMQPAIQSSVRIKNWRLKITFAKPA
jgi:hypothetical protein